VVQRAKPKVRVEVALAVMSGIKAVQVLSVTVLNDNDHAIRVR
jgi:hypothetical protein